MELHVLNDASWLSQLDETIGAKVFVKLGRHGFPVAATAVVDIYSYRCFKSHIPYKGTRNSCYRKTTDNFFSCFRTRFKRLQTKSKV